MSAPRRWALWCWVAVYCAVLFAASSIPGDQVPPPAFWSADKVIHAGAYAVLGWLLVRALQTPGSGTATGRTLHSDIATIALAGVASGIYGISDEWHQSFVPGRHPSGLDVVADLLGGIVGATLRVAWSGRAIRGESSGV